MNLKSQKGYSLLEVGVGLIIIVIFMYYSVTMLRGTYNTYRLIEQRNMIMSYLIKSVENELLDEIEMPLTGNPDDTEERVNTSAKKVVETKIPGWSGDNIIITTTLENLPDKDGKSYTNSKVKLLTSTAEFYIRNGDPASKRTLTLQTYKIGGKELGT